MSLNLLLQREVRVVNLLKTYSLNLAFYGSVKTGNCKDILLKHLCLFQAREFANEIRAGTKASRNPTVMGYQPIMPQQRPPNVMQQPQHYTRVVLLYRQS